MWCIGELDEEYTRRMEDILAVYEKPLNQQEPVVCIDEKPVVLHREVRPPQAMRPGRVARRDGEYERGGTANLFCGVEPKAGRYFPKVTRDRSSPAFADYLILHPVGLADPDGVVDFMNDVDVNSVTFGWIITGQGFCRARINMEVWVTS